MKKKIWQDTVLETVLWKEDIITASNENGFYGEEDSLEDAYAESAGEDPYANG